MNAVPILLLISAILMSISAFFDAPINPPTLQFSFYRAAWALFLWSLFVAGGIAIR